MKPAAPTPFRRKVCSRAALKRAVGRLKRQGKRVVFANGCFDLLHIGHVTLLDRARRLGDALVVAVNSDRSVRGLKGPGRPVNSERDRAAVLAALACVDYVTIFDEPTPLELIRLLRPDVLAKGADWARRDIVGRDDVERHGGRVVRIPLLAGYSTTRVLERLARPAGAASASSASSR